MARPDLLASRNGTTSPLGKLDAELPKQKISGLTIARLQEEATRNGITLAELIRMVLDARAFGIESLRKMYDERIERVVGMRGKKG